MVLVRFSPHIGVCFIKEREFMEREEDKIDFKDYFVVDPSSPTGLRWRDDVARMYTTKQSGTSVAGEPAGVKRIIKGRSDSVVVLLRRKIYIVSRVIWEMVHGPIPEGMIIDHLDGNALNNKIENLACKTRGENMHNRKINKNNKTGFPGILFNGSSYIACWVDNEGTRCRKSFSIRKHGNLAIVLAIELREAKLKELNEKYDLKYTDRHLNGRI